MKGQSYATATSTIGTSVARPSFSEKGLTEHFFPADSNINASSPNTHMLACESNSQRVSSSFGAANTALTCALETLLIMELVWALGMEQGNFDGMVSDSVPARVILSSHGRHIGTFHFEGLMIDCNCTFVDRFGNELLTEDTCAAANETLDAVFVVGAAVGATVGAGGSGAACKLATAAA